MEKKKQKDPKPKVSEEVRKEEKLDKAYRPQADLFTTFHYWDSEENEQKTGDEIHKFFYDSRLWNRPY